jgi:hypothetical protein
VDRHRFDAHPDPTFHFDADPDPYPDPITSFTRVGNSGAKKFDFNLQQCQQYFGLYFSSASYFSIFVSQNGILQFSGKSIV